MPFVSFKTENTVYGLRRKESDNHHVSRNRPDKQGRKGRFDMTLQDITDRIYDTLMNNEPLSNQLDLSRITEQEVDAHDGMITFDYNDQSIKIDIKILR